MRLFRNKFVGIIVLIAIFLVIFYSVIAALGQTLMLRNLLGTVATPFRYVFSAIGGAIGGFGDYFTEFGDLRRENEELSARVNALEAELVGAEVLAGENEWLRGYLGVRENLDGRTLIDATVVGRESNSYRTLYTLSKGTLSGIEVDMAVVTESGIVGRVEAVGATWAEVSVITENASAVGAICARSGVRGIVSGTLGLRKDGKCRMEIADIDADIEVGDAVLSGGFGSVYPYGFTIGTVESFELDEVDRTLYATICPAVDFDKVTRVMVVGAQIREESK